MRTRQRVLIFVAVVAVVGIAGFYAVDRLFPRLLHGRSIVMIGGLPTSDRSREAVARVAPALQKALGEKGLVLGSAVFIRIFKESRELEVWVLNRRAGVYALFRTYAIQSFSGDLGPKLREGDGQAPEGFYTVAAGQMNPLSRFHLSFDVGYPNAFDRGLGRTGSAIMVHGGDASIGCFAMGDDGVEEIYAVAETALRSGRKSFSVHIFPFRMTDDMMARRAGSQWAGFWRNLKTGHDFFENKHVPPSVRISDGRYAF